MATYLGTHGGRIQDYTTDPDNPNTGEVWYNATTNTIKIEAVTTVGGWSSGGNVNTARINAGAAGTKSAALLFGGNTPPVSALTESYNGTSWTEVNDLGTARYGVGGSGGSSGQTASLAFGGTSNSALTELWGGTNWTEVNDLNTGRQLIQSGGTTTSTLAFSGWNPYRAQTESWNGTNWTEVNDLNEARYYAAGAGVDNTEGLCFGGIDQPGGSKVANTESYNGTNWTEVNNLNATRQAFSSFGSATSALAFGDEPSSAATELWNGTNWTEVADLSTARKELAGAGVNNSGGLAISGSAPPYTAVTEEWSGAGSPQVRTISTD